MASPLLTVIKTALYDSRILDVGSEFPLVNEAALLESRGKPLLFRSLSHAVRDPSVHSSLRLANAYVLRDRARPSGKSAGESLRVRQWVCLSPHYSIESYDVLVPSMDGVGQDDRSQVFQDGSFLCQGSVFRVLHTWSSPHGDRRLEDDYMSGSTQLQLILHLFSSSMKPINKMPVDVLNVLVDPHRCSDDRSSCESFSRYSQGDTVSESMSSMLQSCSISRVEDTPVRVVFRHDFAEDTREVDTHFSWMRDAIRSYRRNYSFQPDATAEAWKRWDAKFHDDLSRVLIVNSVDDIINYCGGSRRAVFAAVQLLDRFFSSTDPVSVCCLISERIDGVRYTSNGCETNSATRSATIFNPVNRKNPQLKPYLVSIIGVCCMLGCKIEDKFPPPSERLSKCLKIKLKQRALVGLEMIVFEKLKYCISHNSMEQIIETLLYLMSGDDDSLYISPDSKKNGSTAWAKFQRFCRYIGDITLRGPALADVEKFDATHTIDSQSINPMALGIAVVAFAAKLDDVQLSDALYPLLPRDSTTSGNGRRVPLSRSDKRYELLRDFGQSATYVLQEASSRSGADAVIQQTSCAMDYVACSYDCFQKSHVESRSMSSRYPEWMGQ